MPSIKINQRTFDARPDRIDYRDRPFRPRLISLPPAWPEQQLIAREMKAYTEALILDQGDEGACTGFGLAAMINFVCWRLESTTDHAPERVSMRMLYHMARIYD